MTKSKIKELLAAVALIYPEKFHPSLQGYKTTVNNIEVDITGFNEYGSSYFIKVDGIVVYKSSQPLFLKPNIDKRIDSIVDKIEHYREFGIEKDVRKKIRMFYGK